MPSRWTKKTGAAKSAMASLSSAKSMLPCHRRCEYQDGAIGALITTQGGKLAQQGMIDGPEVLHGAASNPVRLSIRVAASWRMVAGGQVQLHAVLRRDVVPEDPACWPLLRRPAVPRPACDRGTMAKCCCGGRAAQRPRQAVSSPTCGGLGRGGRHRREHSGPAAVAGIGGGLAGWGVRTGWVCPAEAIERAGGAGVGAARGGSGAKSMA